LNPLPSSRRRTALLLIGAALAGAQRRAFAQRGPDIEIIVPNPAGGSTDQIAQVVAGALTELSGETVGLTHVTGNAGVNGLNAVAASVPDGRTLGIAVSNAVVAAKLLTRNARYDPLADFDWLAIFGAYPNAMVVNVASPAQNLREWIVLARHAATPVRCATFGRGSAGHLAAGFLRKTEGIALENVTLEALDDGYARLAAGRIDVLFDGVPNALEEIPRGPFRAIAVTSAERVTPMPAVTAFGEMWKGRYFDIWIGLVAPKGLPTAVYSSLSARLAVICNEPKYVERFRLAGMHFIGAAGKSARDYLEADFIRTGRLIAEFGVDTDR
jgi:tripartite-type tricarboxylate transporter receptor subunit TctC